MWHLIFWTCFSFSSDCPPWRLKAAHSRYNGTTRQKHQIQDRKMWLSAWTQTELCVCLAASEASPQTERFLKVLTVQWRLLHSAAPNLPLTFKHGGSLQKELLRVTKQAQRFMGDRWEEIQKATENESRATFVSTCSSWKSLKNQCFTSPLLLSCETLRNRKLDIFSCHSIRLALMQLYCHCTHYRYLIIIVIIINKLLIK